MAFVTTAVPVTGLAKLATARRVARERLPYFTTLFESMAPLPVPGFGTFGITDNLIMIFDPKLLDEWKVVKLAFVISHEAGHIFHKHSARAARMLIPTSGMKSAIWNIAGDRGINEMLRLVWPAWLPDDCVTNQSIMQHLWNILLPGFPCSKDAKEELGELPKELRNATTEEVYVFLLKTARATLANLASKLAGNGPPGGSGTPCQCGTGAGHKIPGEPGGEHPAGRSEGEVADIIDQTARAVEAAAAEAKTRGTVPSGLLQQANALRAKPKVPWQTKLRHAVSRSAAKQAGAVDFGFYKVARKQAAVGYGHGAPILPSLFAPKLIVEFVVDTSGSMYGKLDAALREGAGIIRALGGQITFVAIDAAIHSDKIVQSPAEMVKLLKGGGGTSFIPYFERLAKRKKHRKPSIVIYATDGEGPAPSTGPRGVQVIWLLIGHNATMPYDERMRKHITWGKEIHIND